MQSIWMSRVLSQLPTVFACTIIITYEQCVNARVAFLNFCGRIDEGVQTNSLSIDCLEKISFTNDAPLLHVENYTR